MIHSSPVAKGTRVHDQVEHLKSKKGAMVYTVPFRQSALRDRAFQDF
jgi:hypothetical protein